MSASRSVSSRSVSPRSVSPRSVSQTARARARAELTAEIVAAAREELADVGPAALSLRSVARRLGMVASGLYRYFPSRDSLLTALIIEAYEAVGAAAAAAADESGPAPMGRWLAVCTRVRAWAGEHPHQWALIYGSPVPGYAAPEATVGAALRITEVVAGLVRDTPEGHPPEAIFPPAGHLEAVIDPLRETLMPGRPAEVAVAALMAWTSLIGMVSLELFGHYKGGTTDFDAVFSYAMEAAGRAAGLA
ncbi:MAG TPA: TetR/AcrR family transcriptional regulator [Acidimicrobiales bacterium]|nr:TetR/AcrR family transcriptional regulator [Acidimicrobiales bacterium]